MNTTSAASSPAIYRQGCGVVCTHRQPARPDDAAACATLLDKLLADGGEVISVGKISDIYAHQGISRKVKATGNAALFDATLEALRDAADRQIVFTNFVDFDMLYGHRRDVNGYAAALEYFDQRLPELLDACATTTYS